MKTLETSFEKKGWTFNQVIRTGDFAIFARNKNDGPIHYEVVVIRRHNGLVFNGVRTEPAEFLPNDSEWGVKAWTYNDLEKAEKKLEALTTHEKRTMH